MGFRFSIRGLLILTTILALTLGRNGYERYLEHRAQRAVATLEQKGHFVSTPAFMTNHEKSHITFQPPVSVGDIELAARVPSIRTAHVNIPRGSGGGIPKVTSSVTASHLRALSGLQNLRWLTVSGIEDSDAIETLVSALPALHTLVIVNSPIDNEALERIGGLRSLEVLKIYPNGQPATFDDEGFGALKGLKSLRELSLCDGNIKGRNLAMMVARLNLFDLQLSGNPIDDPAVEHMINADPNFSIDLRDTRITDRGICDLVQRNRLLTLTFSQACLTDQSIEAMKQFSANVNMFSIAMTDKETNEIFGLRDLAVGMPGISKEKLFVAQQHSIPWIWPHLAVPAAPDRQSNLFYWVVAAITIIAILQVWRKDFGTAQYAATDRIDRGDTAFENGEYEDAEEYYLEAVAHIEKVRKQESRESLFRDHARNLGMLKLHTGNDDEAEKHFVKSLAFDDRLSTPISERILKLCQLARVYGYRPDNVSLTKAIDALIDLCRQADDVEFSKSTQTLFDFISCCRGVAMNREGLRILEVGQQRLRQQHDSPFKDVLDYETMRIVLLVNCGDYPAATQAYHEGMRQLQRWDTQCDVQLVIRMMIVGGHLAEAAGNWEEARRCSQEVIQCVDEGDSAYGDELKMQEHINLALLAYLQGEPERSETHFRRVYRLADFESIHTCPSYYATLPDLSLLLALRGQQIGALDVLHAARNNARRWAPYDRWTVEQLNYVHAFINIEGGRSRDAAASLEDSLQFLQDFYPNDHVIVLLRRIHLARALMDVGEFAKAESILAETSSQLKRDRDANLWMYAISTLEHTESLMRIGRIDDAWSCLEGVQKVADKTLGLPLAAYRTRVLAELYLERNHKQEAIGLLREAESQMVQALPQYHPELVHIRELIKQCGESS